MKLFLMALSCGVAAGFHLTFDGSCFETSYSDAALVSEGWKEGACDTKFDVLFNETHTTVCTGHSEEDVSNCDETTDIAASEPAACAVDCRASVADFGNIAGNDFATCFSDRVAL